MPKRFSRTSSTVDLTSASREQVCELIVRWLFLFPLQRSEDIVVALAPWRPAVTVRRYLADLHTRGLLEWTLAGCSQGKRLYHLSPAGVRWYLAHSQEPSADAEAVIREMRHTLVRLLPRLPALLPVQKTINGLVTGAADALTHEGRRATLIRWDWQREYRKEFSYRERPWHLVLEGVCSLCLQYEPAWADHREAWHTLFIYHTPVQDAYVMRLRLDHFLRWRESPERWSVYSQVPLLLILARTPRQAEWWQQACLRTAEALHVDLPYGALAVLPEDARAIHSPWHLAWRSLGTNQSCHLQELVHPLAQPVVPVRANLSLSVASTAKAAAAKTREGAAKTRTRPSFSQPYRLALRAQQACQHGCEQPDEVRLASLILVPRQWEILDLLLQHPFLSRANLCALLELQRNSLNTLLAPLDHWGVVVSELTRADERWKLTEPGLRLLSAALRCSIHHLAFQEDDCEDLSQRGVRGLRHQIIHTAGVYGFLTRIATTPGVRLRWWESGVSCERSYLYAGRMHRFRPDALAEIATDAERLRFWLEWDRGTITSSGLARKIATYAEYLTTRECMREHRRIPRLLCVVSDLAQERAFMKVLTTGLPQVPRLVCLTTTLSLLERQGLLAPIWLPAPYVTPETSRAGRAPPEINRRLAPFEGHASAK